MTTTDDKLERELKKLYAHVPPPPGGLAAGRERLLAEAAHLKARAVSVPVSRDDAAQYQNIRGRRKMKLFLAYKIIVAVMAVIVGTTAAGGGVLLAASDSLPGDTLYPLELFVEDTRLSLTADPAARAALNLTFAAKRAGEIQQLAAKGMPLSEDVIARMVRHTEQVMAQIAQAQQEDVPGLLERVRERARAQEQVLVQVRSLAPEEAQPALHRALEAMKRAYETASAGLQDPYQFRMEYQRRYGGTPGPHGEASPAHPLTPPCETCTPVQEKHQEREQNQNQDQTVTPAGTPWQERKRERNQDVAVTPGLDQGQLREQEQNWNQAATPVSTPEGERDRDRNREMTHTPEPPGPCQTCVPEPNQDRTREREQERTYTLEPTSTPDPTSTPTPAFTAPPAQVPDQGPSPTRPPGPTATPQSGGNGGGH